MDLLSHLNEAVPPRQASFCPEHSNKGVGITLCNAERDRNDIIQRPFANPSPTTSENSAQQAIYQGLKSFKVKTRNEPDNPDFYQPAARVRCN